MKNSLILIIEDDTELNDVLSEMATSSNYDVLQAHNGQEAIALLTDAQKQPVLVLCDVKMPVMGGLEFVKQTILKDLDLNICLISGNNDKTEIVEGLRLGVIDYIDKPVSFKDLQARLKLMVDIGKRKDQIKNQLKDNNAAKISIRLNNLMKLKKGFIHEK